MDPERFLPLSEATFLILLSLANGPKHGYLIMREVERLSAGKVIFSTGTLYGAIRAYQNCGIVSHRSQFDIDCL